jgi:hypothetical protein
MPIPGMQRGMEGALERSLPMRPNWHYHDPNDFCRIDWKSDLNMTPYQGIVNAVGYGPEEEPWDALAEHYPAELVEFARETHREVSAAHNERRTIRKPRLAKSQEKAVVWAGMATLRERASLRPQVDRITVTPGDDKGGELKFASCEQAPGYFFSVDDDLVYPPDYIENTLDALERYPGAVVGYHGANFREDGTRIKTFRCLGEVVGDHHVHSIGTGVCAFHVDTIRPTLEDFPTPNAVDYWFAVKAALAGVPLIVLPHPADYFSYVKPPRTIWQETADQTGSPLDASVSKATALAQLIGLLFRDRCEEMVA